MEFVNPGILYGLLAVSIPVIIHLFNFRRFRKVYFTNVAFIKELKQETQKQSRLKHLLVLLMRMLAVAALVFAFARPYFPLGENVLQQQETNSISIYIDNSFSLQAESEKGTMLDLAREKAMEIASVYKSSDRFQLLTNDLEGRHQRFVSKDEFVDLLDDVEISPVVKTLSQMVVRQEDLLKQESAKVKTAFIISDFQKGFLSENIPQPDSSVNFLLLPLQATNSDNLYIDSCWFETPVQQINQNAKLLARLINSSDQSYDKFPVKLSINGTQKALASFDVGPQQSVIVELPFTNNKNGVQQGVIEIDDYPLTFDDRFYFSYHVKPVIEVLSINGNGENVFLRSLFFNDSLVNFENVQEGMLNYSNLPGYDLVILNELIQISSGLASETKQFVENGGNLLILPSLSSDLENYNTFLTQVNAGRISTVDTTRSPVSYINIDHPLYADVFENLPENMSFPVAFAYFPIQVSRLSLYDKILGLQNGNIFMKANAYGLGMFYLSASPYSLSATDFMQNSLFVPTVYKMALSGNGDEKLFYTIGEEENIHVGRLSLSSEQVVKIRGKENFEIIPEIRNASNNLHLSLHGQIAKADNYWLVDNSGKTIEGLALNYSRAESEMTFSENSEIENYIASNGLTNFSMLAAGDKPIEKTLTELGYGIQLWRWFVLAALVFLLLEILILRVFTKR
jgi:hypothetical protein